MESHKLISHDDRSFLIARAEMLKIIVKAISQCGIRDLSEENAIRLARYLEKQLLKSSPNMQSYSNVYTIDERVKKACTGLAYRILAKKRKKCISKGCIQEAKLKSIYKGWKCGGTF